MLFKLRPLRRALPTGADISERRGSGGQAQIPPEEGMSCWQSQSVSTRQDRNVVCGVLAPVSQSGAWTGGRGAERTRE